MNTDSAGNPIQPTVLCACGKQDSAGICPHYPKLVEQPSTPPSKISGGALHVEDDLIPPTAGSTPPLCRCPEGECYLHPNSPGYDKVCAFKNPAPPSPVEATVQSAEEWVSGPKERELCEALIAKDGDPRWINKMAKLVIAFREEVAAYASSLLQAAEAKNRSQEEEIAELKRKVEELEAYEAEESAFMAKHGILYNWTFVDGWAKVLDQLSEQRALMGEMQEALEHLVQHTERRGDACKLLAVGKADAVLSKLSGPKKENS